MIDIISERERENKDLMFCKAHKISQRIEELIPRIISLEEKERK